MINKKASCSWKSIRFYYQNVRGLRSKTTTVRRNMPMIDADVVALTETFLNSSVCDGELFSDEYTIIRKDRTGDVGWGLGRCSVSCQKFI